MKSVLLSALLVFFGQPLLAQDSTYHKKWYDWEVKSTDILLGINWQGNTSDNKMLRYFEMGIAKGRYISHRHGITGGAVYASEEIYFGRDKNIFGTKVGAWMHWMLDFGAAIVYYTDLKRGNLKIRPEFGFGMGRLRAVFGYNIPTINNKAFEQLRRNNIQLSIQLTIGVHKKQIK